MSALAARRAAAAAQSSAASSTASSPAPSRGASASAARRSQTAPRRGDVLPEQQLSQRARTSIGSPSDASDSPVPSKRARIDRDPLQRHSTGESSRSVDTSVQGKSKAKQMRKRAFSPSAPMESSDDDEDGEEEEGGGRSSDEDSAAGTGSGQDEDDMPDEQEEPDGGAQDEGVTPYGSPGPWRPRPLDTTTAISNFTPRRGHNIDLLPAKLLDKCGYEGTGDGLLIALRRNEYIYLAGAYCLKPVRGEISIFGSTRTGDDNDHSLHVFAPISHAMSAIVGVNGRGHILRKQPLDLLSNLPTTVPKDYIQAYIIVRGLSTGLEGMRGGAIPGFATAWGPERGWMGTVGIQSVPGSIIAPCYPYQQPTSWTRALACLRRGAKYAQSKEDRRDLSVLVKGPKRSGKSSVARAAVNTLLKAGRRSSVAWLECDLGQGEFGCGGVIGLWVLREPIFGPAFTHPRLPYRAHFLGTYTPLTCPDEYLAAIQHLLHVYHTELSEEMYLVINTQGWVKGLGEELLRSIEKMADATYTFSFDTKEEEHDDDDGDRNDWTRSPGPADVDDDDALSTASEDGVRRGRLRLEQAPVTPLQQRYAAADYRNLSTLSYLHASFNPDPYDRNDRRPTWDFTSPIIAMPPLEVSLSPDGPLRAVYMQGEGAEGIAERDLPLALNGALVALIHDQSDVEAPAESAVYIQGRPLPALDSVNCLGLALVRAVVPIPQMQNGLVLSAPPSGYKLHLITPLPAYVLAKANAVIRNGAMELPTPAMLDWRSGAGTGGVSEEGLVGVPWGEVPFFGPETAGVGMEKRRVRRNLMRKGM